ncbi:hypothetical protein KAR91_52410 [Candidatus Pacearchaeota archaeon]|nr:hypothetical protein [Candidatus Pacearchaeota archaeon]
MPLDKPNQPYTNPENSYQSPMPNYIPDVSIRGESWDQLVQNRGIRFIHKVAAPCPNMKSLVDNNHDPECPFCDGSQILYVQEKEIFGTFSSNTLEKMFEIQGVWEIGTAVITFPTEFEDGTQADFNIFDKLACPDFQIRLSDLKEYNGSGTTGTKYPVINVLDMTSIVADAVKKYVQGVDFNIVDGDIVWVAGKEPAYDNLEEMGEVLSITYSANPVYNVMQTLHEIRATQQMVDGQKVAKRLPQQVLVKRDFLFKPDNEA